MSDNFLTWGIPAIAVLMGAVLCVWGWWGSRRFSKKYPDDRAIIAHIEKHHAEYEKNRGKGQTFDSPEELKAYLDTLPTGAAKRKQNQRKVKHELDASRNRKSNRSR
jgi:hypothetical protein